MIKFLIIIITVALAICLGFIVYHYGIYPSMESQCVMGTNSCIEIPYYFYKNTALIELPNFYWVWFTGAEFLVYGAESNNSCIGTNLSQAFVVNVGNTSIQGYRCTFSPETIKETHYKNSKLQYLYINTKDCINLLPNECGKITGCTSINGSCTMDVISAFDVINIMLEREIITSSQFVIEKQ